MALRALRPQDLADSLAMTTTPPLEHAYVKANGLRLHVVASGPPDGRLVILLHGFPEFWYGWRAQLTALASAGYRVLVPDQRGYNLSDKPRGIAAYTLEQLAQDVLGLIDAAGRDKAYLVGHDWGAAVAWWAALEHPHRVEQLVAINVPHPHVMRQTLSSSVPQLLRSWYIFFFQLPYFPEVLARRRDWQLLRNALTSTSRLGTFAEADLRRYCEAWSQPGAFTAMLNWYRAALRCPPTLGNPHVWVLTLLIWGAQDRFLSRRLAEPSVALCRRGELVILEGATHWVQHEEAEEVNRLILGFFS